MTDMLICPKTHKKLELSENGEYYQTEDGIVKYPIEEGVIKFIGKNDEFYEGAYKNTVNYIPVNEKLFHVLPLWIISNGYLWFTRKYIPENSKVLELGCASGVKYFGKRYEMIGLDLSFSSLVGSVNIYQKLIQADATEIIPLMDNSVDAVISSYFWEHITYTDKNKILKECYRVLKPNGKMIFLFDIETENPLIKKIKEKNYEFYNNSFLEKDGHLGYHTPDENKNILKNNSFEIIYTFGMEKTFLLSPSVYGKLENLLSGVKYYYKIINKLSNKFLKSYLLILRLLDTIFKNILPDSWARIYLLVVRKK